MSKRTATTELNHDNWGDEEEPETAGVFKKASVAELKNRQFRTARRRGAPSGGDSTEDSGNVEKGVFAGFGGFKKAEPASSKALFSFLSATPNGKNTQSDTASSTSSSNALKTSFTSTDGSDKKTLNGVDADAPGKSSDKEYHRRLRGLNESVSKWISKHVAENPLIILTPVFRDYEKHLANIQNRDDCKPSESIPSTDLTKQESDDSNKNSSALKDVLQTGSNSSGSKTLSEDKKPLTGSVFGSPAGSATTATFSFGSFASSAASSQSTSSSFCFGSPTSTNTSNPTPATFSFGSGNSTSPSAGFSFGGTGKPFTFSNVANTNSTEEKKDDNEDADEDTPPKPDHKPVNEDGATYTKRCKVFFKQDNAYSDRGIGNLFLKPVDGGKTQLIVRADTSLGNVLLNFIVGSSLPIQRIGTNNVAVVCIPTPDTKPPPVTVLLRVKTSDDADELFKTLEKHKKEA